MTNEKIAKKLKALEDLTKELDVAMNTAIAELNDIRQRLEVQSKQAQNSSTGMPVALEFRHNEDYYCVGSSGVIVSGGYKACDGIARDGIKKHRYFKTRKEAEVFREKTQLIADMLYFKHLYDNDFTPDYNNPNSEKWCVIFDLEKKAYDAKSSFKLIPEPGICFSSEAIARKCAYWLNGKISSKVQAV